MGEAHSSIADLDRYLNRETPVLRVILAAKQAVTVQLGDPVPYGPGDISTSTIPARIASFSKRMHELNPSKGWRAGRQRNGNRSGDVRLNTVDVAGVCDESDQNGAALRTSARWNRCVGGEDLELVEETNAPIATLADVLDRSKTGVVASSL